MDGTATRTDDGSYILRFERHFDHPITKVWDAITDPSELTKWIAGDDANVELRVGGRVRLSGHGGIDGEVLAVEPPHIFEYEWKTSEWDGGPIRFELAEEGTGTKLTFTHRFPTPDMAEQERLMKKMGFGPDMYDPIPRNLAGWHSLLDALARSLGSNAPEVEWKEIHNHYVAELSGS